MQRPSQRTELSLLLFKLETTRGVDALPTPENDAFLVGDLDLQLDPTQLERNVVRRSFSPIPSGVGRKVVNVTFTHEIKGSGDVGVTRPKLGALLRACGMKEILVTAGAATQIEDPVPFGNVTSGPKPTFAKTTAPTQLFGSYLVNVVTGGGDGVAAVQVSRWESGEQDDTVLPNTRNTARVNNSSGTTLVLDDTDLTSLVYTVGGTPAAGDQLFATIGGVTFFYTVTDADAGSGTPTETIATNLAALINADARLSAIALGSVITVTFAGNAAAVVLTSGTTAIPLGDSGAAITPTWTGNLVKGQQWVVVLLEEGFMYKPTSNSLEIDTATLYVFFDGMLHKVTAGLGTVTFNGEGGNIATAEFTFQGNFIAPVEEPVPLDATLEATQPPQVELAQMSIKGDSDFCSQAFTYTLGNEQNPKECINKADGFDGSQITGRTPTASHNPESTFEAFHNMWTDFSIADQFPLHTRVGSVAGNIVRFYAPRANFTGLTYGDRNGTRTLEAEFQLNGLSAAGDDELRVAFT